MGGDRGDMYSCKKYIRIDRVYIYIYIHVEEVCAYVRIYIYIYIHVEEVCAYVHIYIYIYTYIHVNGDVPGSHSPCGGPWGWWW